MTVAHKNLSGTDLHEPKGIGSASLNTVYVCTSAGVTGTWQKVDIDQLTGAAKAFQGQLLHIRDEKSPGTDGGTFSSGAWRTRDLNTTLTNEISGASLSTNQITLPAGTYFIDASAPAQSVNSHIAKLYNVTDAADVITGSSAQTDSAGGYASNRSFIKGRFTIAGSKVFEIQHRCLSTNGSGFGDADGNLGANEVYTEVLIWKVG